MRVLEYTVPAECDGMTVRDFARHKLSFSARMLTRQKKLENGIVLNGAHCRSVDVLCFGDRLVFNLPDEDAEYCAKPLPLSVLYESEDYLVVDKQPNMPIHPSPGHDCDSLLNAVAYYYDKTGQSGVFRPLYRLDKDTSGIVIIGKHKAAVSSAKVEKRYFTVCHGELLGKGTIDVPIGLKADSKIVRECGHGDTAVTHWRAVESKNGYTLLSVKLETGRTHQIRAHMAHVGCPLAGDDLYGGNLNKISRQALHCGFAKVSCSALSTETKFISDFPEDIRQAFPWLPSVRELIKEE